jgi:hypothetical protein
MGGLIVEQFTALLAAASVLGLTPKDSGMSEFCLETRLILFDFCPH